MLAFLDELNPNLHVGSGISHNTHLALKLRYWHYLATRRGPDTSSHGSKPLFQQLDCNRDAPLSNRLALVSTKEQEGDRLVRPLVLDPVFECKGEAGRQPFTSASHTDTEARRAKRSDQISLQTISWLLDPAHLFPPLLLAG